MRIRGRERAGDVIDARGGRSAGGRGVRVGGGLGLTGVLIVLALQFLGGGGAGLELPPGLVEGARAPAGEPIPAKQDPERDLREFSGYVFSRAQDTWATIFEQGGRQYERARLVLYRDTTATACGQGSAAAGPFYCPADRRVYLDLSFYGEMERTLRAPGDFAWAYVIAHEVGHHVQQVLGTEQAVRDRRRDAPDDANDLSVRLELQADCFAGVWASSVFAAGDLEPGDVEEAMTASASVGDDRLQRQSGRAVNPDAFTHGSSAQRTRWFDAGRRRGDPSSCDTFAADEL